MSVGSRRSMAHDRLYCREACAPWVPKNLTEVTKLVVWDSVTHVTCYGYQGYQFQHCIVAGEET